MKESKGQNNQRTRTLAPHSWEDTRTDGDEGNGQTNVKATIIITCLLGVIFMFLVIMRVHPIQDLFIRGSIIW